MKYKYYYSAEKTKFSKKEKEIFVDKQYLIILTFPIKYLDSKQLNNINKKFPMLNISIVYSKNATKNSFFHCFFRPEDFVFDTWKNVMNDKTKYIKELFNEIENIKRKHK